MSAETTTGWPYDADEHDPLTAMRIPVTSFAPGWKYTACFDRESEARPTDAEAHMIASFIEEYQDHWFGDGAWRQKQLSQAFDMDCYTTTVFHKWADDDWSYRCVTWRYGPHWVPVMPRLRGGEHDYPKCPGPLPLVRVMDHVHTLGSEEPMTRWVEWKAAHPDVFGGTG